MMKIKSTYSILVLAAALLLGGCAASQLPGYENTYQGYNVPESLVATIRANLKKYGLPNAQVTRDNVGRIRLIGSYRNEDEVDEAFVIVQSVIGIKSTSPLYPENIQEKRWEIEAKKALDRHANAMKLASEQSIKRALIIGINNFLDKGLEPIQGEYDARLVKSAAEKAGYRTTALLGPQATKKNIEDALQRLSGDLKPNDSLLIYISSHGNPPIPSPLGGDVRKMSIAAFDSSTRAGDYNGQKIDNGQLMFHKTSVSDTKVQELARMPTRQTRVIIDTCYSGEILKGIPDESARYILKTNGGVPEQAGISMAAWNGPAYASKGIFATSDSGATAKNPTGRQAASVSSKNSAQYDINRYTIITATSDGEKSWGPDIGGSFASPVNKDKQLKGSFFTQAFFEYLDVYGGHLEPAFRDARNFTATKVATDVSRGRGLLIRQTPRLNPPLPAGDTSNIYN